MTIRTTSAAFVLLAAVTLAGCSSSDGSDDTPPPAPKAPTASGKASTAAPTDGKAALVAAVKAYSAAYFKPDAAAGHALLSARCQAKISSEDYRAALDQAIATYGHQDVKTVAVDSITTDMARVTYTYSVPALDQHGQIWIREGGAWRYDAC
jgi:hypothetical protein